ncbi:MAG: deoxyribonuclease IV [Mariniblastus sp.]|nr:deoxyribonuclease IV [Mariniblastus sp.]
MILGAHMSIAGGYYKAVIAANNAGCDCVQVFTKNNNQWRAKPITDDDATRFVEAMKEHSIADPLSHASYLINLASPKEELRTKSIDAMIVELERAHQLEIPHVVFHPGSFTTSSEPEGLDAIVDSLNTILQRTDKLASIPLLENTAGQGSNLGWKFEHLAYIIDSVSESERLGVCIDTCHTFAAGHPLGSTQEYASTLQAMDETFGIEKIKAFHLNDSKKEFGSRKDRHEHIGEGEMGIEPFVNLINDSRFEDTPMYLETEKGERDGVNMDVMNLTTLRNLKS